MKRFLHHYLPTTAAVTLVAVALVACQNNGRQDTASTPGDSVSMAAPAADSMAASAGEALNDAKVADIATKKTVRAKPNVGETPPLDFPDVQHVTLSNGMKLAYAQRTTVPVTQLALSFDAGFAADVRGRRGLQNLTLGLLKEGLQTF